MGLAFLPLQPRPWTLSLPHTPQTNVAALFPCPSLHKHFSCCDSHGTEKHYQDGPVALPTQLALHDDMMGIWNGAIRMGRRKKCGLWLMDEVGCDRVAGCTSASSDWELGCKEAFQSSLLFHMLMLMSVVLYGAFSMQLASFLHLSWKNKSLNCLHFINYTILKSRTHSMWVVENLDFDFMCCSGHLEQLIILPCNSWINPELFFNLSC